MVQFPGNFVLFSMEMVLFSRKWSYCPGKMVLLSREMVLLSRGNGSIVPGKWSYCPGKMVLLSRENGPLFPGNGPLFPGNGPFIPGNGQFSGIMSGENGPFPDHLAMFNTTKCSRAFMLIMSVITSFQSSEIPIMVLGTRNPWSGA